VSRDSAARAFVKRLIMLVTPDGRWVIEDSAEFLAALGDTDPDYDAALFAVKNLGFIKFQILEGSLVEIELHPRNVQLPALLAVQQQILSSRAKLFRIKYFETSWLSEITSSSERAISRLAELCAPTFAPPSTEKFLVEPRDYSALFDDRESPLRPMVQKWRMSFGHFDPSVISFAIKQQLLSKMMIVGVKPKAQDAIFRFIGDGFRWTNDSFQLNAIGERVENQPDKEYGGWVAEFYKSVASTGQPRYDCVTAAIHQPAPGSWRTGVIRYERLLLPWRTPSEEILVTLSSKMLEEDVVTEPLSSETESSVVRKLARSS
jgi:hypothetical protein